MTEFPIKWSFEELQIKLPEQLIIKRSRKKRNEAKNNCLMDSGNTYNKTPLLSNCFLLKILIRTQLFHIYSKVTKTEPKSNSSIFQRTI